jgi:serine/threonine-protein kinase
MTDLLDRLKTALADRYAIDRELGSGGMAVVFLAHDQKLGRPVALKVLRPELAASLGAERFLREIEIAAKLTHPNILALYDCGEADGLLYYTMPYVEGESLRERLKRERQLPIEDALQITREVAEALGHAHEQGSIARCLESGRPGAHLHDGRRVRCRH